MHYLQTQILQQLALKSPARYSDLKPQTIEGNLFTYHLRALIRRELISHAAQTYTLTQSGLLYVESLSLTTQQPRIQAKIVTLIACRREDGAWLLYLRDRQPFKGRAGFPYGKIHMQETVINAAQRELFDKSGLKSNLQHIADVYLTTTQQGELISQMLAHICVGSAPQEADVHSPCFWEMNAASPKQATFPGFEEVLALAQQALETAPPAKNTITFAEYTFNL